MKNLACVFILDHHKTDEGTLGCISLEFQVSHEAMPPQLDPR